MKSAPTDWLANRFNQAVAGGEVGKNNAEEVTFKDIQEGTWRTKPAAHKIEFCANQASRDNLQYFWVDTCCIDKSTMDEVQESINSMFRWYRNATQCYVYLSDVSMNNPVGSDGVELSWEDAFRTSKWFTRGWTLQELLAPESVKFFSQESLYIGDKKSLQLAIHDITTIPTPALQKADSLNQFHADERLRWAETRETTREEDWVYCLLGIFGIFMPLNYGEGKDNAIKRLRMEIGNIPKRQARYLADEVLPSAALRTTCYFFFKEDFEDQRSSVIALRSILHQIFDHYPGFFSSQVLEKLQDKGDTLLNSFGDLWEMLLSAVDMDLVPEIRFRDDIRQLCGLFVVIVDSKIYLLHQTAREFLVPPALTESPSPACSIVAKWEYSFHPKESNRILAEICLQRLALKDLNGAYYKHDGRGTMPLIHAFAANIFGEYSANQWASHFRETNWDTDHPTVLKATSCCRLDPQRIGWLDIYTDHLYRTKEVRSDDAPVIIASYLGLSPVVERLLRGVNNINTIIGWGSRTAAFWASAGGYHATLQLLLEAGADVNIHDENRSTPLHKASRAGHGSIVQQLLKAGADINIQDRYKSTPLHLASEAGYSSIVQQLIEAGADMNILNQMGSTPLHHAFNAGYGSIIQQLLKAGADVNIQDKYRSTPLHQASKADNSFIVQQLIEAGADVNIYNRIGSTPLHLASKAGHSFIVQKLLEAGANANTYNRIGSTPLHQASEAGYGSIVQQLLIAGAEVNHHTTPVLALMFAISLKMA
ncbi:unnamed protein product [Parascedosporium putredinis]|uniref:Heterokaryon incompatibility domain-containing protein n=1 Tax=Parascedosporium putredinis TaxID=1442378 RepID=A0A9P1GXZ5_9PEZI|nr:unnamed protein product [Parascedosporium putredinis]CAI7990280.1 unnamed protein product [Parascedosporium putredinis]